jgi:hypothetical protein
MRKTGGLTRRLGDLESERMGLTANLTENIVSIYNSWENELERKCLIAILL